MNVSKIGDVRENAAKQLKQNALNAKGDTSCAFREDVWNLASALTRGASQDSELSVSVRELVEVVALRAQDTNDAHINAVRTAGYSDDALFEITVATAVSAGVARLKLALTALKQEQE